MRRKTAARVLTVQALYQFDVRGSVFLGELAAFLAESSKDAEQIAFAEERVRGCVECMEELDARIAEVSEHWGVSRMAQVDRAILRLGTYELLHCPDVPPKVALDEAIRLAKKFSTGESSAFVNGILDRLMKRFADEREGSRA